MNKLVSRSNVELCYHVTAINGEVYLTATVEAEDVYVEALAVLSPAEVLEAAEALRKREPFAVGVGDMLRSLPSGITPTHRVIFVGRTEGGDIMRRMDNDQCAALADELEDVAAWARKEEVRTRKGYCRKCGTGLSFGVCRDCQGDGG